MRPITMLKMRMPFWPFCLLSTPRLHDQFIRFAESCSQSGLVISTTFLWFCSQHVGKQHIDQKTSTNDLIHFYIGNVLDVHNSKLKVECLIRVRWWWRHREIHRDQIESRSRTLKCRPCEAKLPVKRTSLENQSSTIEELHVKKRVTVCLKNRSTTNLVDFSWSLLWVWKEHEGTEASELFSCLTNFAKASRDIQTSRNGPTGWHQKEGLQMDAFVMLFKVFHQVVMVSHNMS
jgi:hypothetical protein